jgi:hypothetical protein
MFDPRRQSAVEGYCRELCPRETAAAAATESLESFSGKDDLDLLRHTRSVAAKYAPVAPARRGWRRALSAERDSPCRFTPALLAASENGELDDRRRARLENHLATCVACQAAELRARRADRAFAAVTGIALAAEATPPVREAASHAVEAEPSEAEIVPIAPVQEPPEPYVPESPGR